MTLIHFGYFNSAGNRCQSILALIKEGLEGSLDMSIKEVLEWEASHQAVMLQSPEHKEIVKQFLKSRGKDKS